ncbi:MAG: hypothetical protein GY716_16580 [bacterium]|nr:hypothetical protein [bacterium]
MKRDRARLVTNVALGLLLAWPAAQMVLVRGYGLNPWKLAGWGMYAAPQLEPQVSIECLTPDEVGRYELSSVQPAWRREFERFVRRRSGLGRLARPDELARKLLDEYPAVDAVEITVEQPRLNPRTGMVEAESTTYAHARDASVSFRPRPASRPRSRRQD